MGGRRRLRRFFLYALFPAIFHAGAVALLTYPWVQQFSTHLYANDIDGFQNAWNLWWIDQAVTSLHRSPWYTTYLHYPDGISLYAHTLNPFNGLLAIPLLRYLSLIETYNAATVFAFVMSGVTAFWLAYALTQSYVGSLLGGYVFTFSEYHFAHAQLGQLNLVSLEWLPAFVLTFYWLVTRPGILIAIAAALSLFAVVLCDYYYFLYAVITASLLLMWYGHKHRSWAFWLDRPRVVAAAWFVLVSVATTVPVVVGFVLASQRNGFVGAHDPTDYSLDLAALFIPGATSRFSGVGPEFWGRLLQPEQSVYFGYGPIASLIYVWRKRRTTKLPDLGFWYLLIVVFAILGCGPRLHLLHFEVPLLRLPYAWLATLVPIITLSGCPVRMIVMITLVGSLCVAETWRLCLDTARFSHVALAAALATAVVLQGVPATLPVTQVPLPPVVVFLGAQPGNEGYFDATVEPLLDLQGMDLRPMSHQMYFQTIHQKPIAYGYTSRNTLRSIEHDSELQRLASLGDFRTLRCKFSFKWLLSERVISQQGVNRILLPQSSGGDSPAYLYELDQPCETGDR